MIAAAAPQWNVRVEVTSWHIKHSKVADPCLCAVARAITDALRADDLPIRRFEPVTVDGHEARAWTADGHIWQGPLPLDVQQRIRVLDSPSRLDVEPFAFDLQMRRRS